MINAKHIWCDTKIYILWHWSLVNLTNYTYDCFMSSPLHGLVWKGLSTHWGRVTHICVGNLTIIGPDNGLWPGRCQAIIWTNAGMLLIGPWGTNFSEILIGIHTFSFKKINLKMSSAKWRPFHLGLKVLNAEAAVITMTWWTDRYHLKVTKPFTKSLFMIILSLY